MNKAGAPAASGLPPVGGPFHEVLKWPSDDAVWIVEQNGRVHSVHATHESAMAEKGENLRIGAPWRVLAAAPRPELPTCHMMITPETSCELPKGHTGNHSGVLAAGAPAASGREVDDEVARALEVYRNGMWPLKAIEAVKEITDQVWNQDEQPGCVFCGGTGPKGSYATENPKHHSADCPWLRLREVLAASAAAAPRPELAPAPNIMRARIEALSEAALISCQHCRDGNPFDDSYLHHVYIATLGGGAMHYVKCEASAIRKLIDMAVKQLLEAEREAPPDLAGLVTRWRKEARYWKRLDTSIAEARQNAFTECADELAAQLKVQR